MHVLVVDDETALLNSLARSLRFEGYRITTAEDGAEALDCLVDSRPDAMILDVVLPEVDGVEVCRRMRAMGSSAPSRV